MKDMQVLTVKDQEMKTLKPPITELPKYSQNWVKNRGDNENYSHNG